MPVKNNRPNQILLFLFFGTLKQPKIEKSKVEDIPIYVVTRCINFRLSPPVTQNARFSLTRGLRNLGGSTKRHF